MSEDDTFMIGRLLKVHNRHGWFAGNLTRVDLVLEAFDNDIDLMRLYMNEAGGPSIYNDVFSCVELAIMVADVTPHLSTLEEYVFTAGRTKHWAK